MVKNSDVYPWNDFSVKLIWNPFLSIKSVSDGGEFIQATKSIDEKTIIRDPVLSGVLAFSTKINMSELALVKENKLVLQDRASCLPPYILNVTKKDTVLDCCAAPGLGHLPITAAR